jgi:pyrroline-5-carboxylate reductase
MSIQQPDNPLASRRIAFIGAGNMAFSLVAGLLRSGVPAAQISAADPYQPSLDRLGTLGPVSTGTDNVAAIAGADLVVLAVKPQTMADAAASIAASVVRAQPLVVSIAAGTTLATLGSLLGTGVAMVRCMPNTPALLGAGATALYPDSDVSTGQRELAQALLATAGIVCWVPRESDLDTVTALSGSGPAYFFLLIEAMADAAVDMGLDVTTAQALARQTALGAARMACEPGADVVALRRQVTSPGGTTAAALASLEAADLRGIMATALQAAADRARQMAQPTDEEH